MEPEDSRRISVPLAWLPRLRDATPGERDNWEIVGGGEGVRWPDLDEDIEAAHLLAGIPSQESRGSLKRWLSERQKEGGPEEASSCDLFETSL